MANQITEDHQLLELIKTAIMSCTTADAFTAKEKEVLVDDEDVRSVLVLIQFHPFNIDDGRITPDPITLQFDRQKNVGPKDGDDYCVMITGEDTEWEITPGNVYAGMYFNSLKLETPKAKSEPALEPAKVPIKPKCTCEHDHDFDCPQHGTNAWDNAFQLGLSSAN